MSKHFMSNKAICPYYKDEIKSKDVVRCSGHDPECTLHVTFSCPKDLKKHLRERCYSFEYKKCPYYWLDRG